MNTSPPTISHRPASHLPRVLGFTSAVALVVGEMVGSGIFFKPGDVARATGGYLGVVLALWIGCGLVNLCGALALAELSAMFPHTGGTYVFLREAYGRCWAFLWCWTEFWVIRTGAIALLASYSALSVLDCLQTLGWYAGTGSAILDRELIAIGLIVLLAATNAAGTRWGSGVQNVLTAIKVGFVLLLALLPLLALAQAARVKYELWPTTVEPNWWVGIGTALAAIMWAYDGWGNVTVVAEEIHDPERNVPRALIGGVLAVIVLYAGANVAFHLSLSAQELGRSHSPAVEVCERLLPHIGKPLMLAMLVISQAGALNGNLMVGPRVLYAVAGDFWFLARLRSVHPTARTPHVAIGLEAFWAALLIVLGDLFPSKVSLFERLTSYCIFAGSVFYLSAVLAVFVFRLRHPNAARPYRAWGYPYTPALFGLFYALLIVSIFRSSPLESSLGLTFLSLGGVVYWLGNRLTKPD